MMKTIFIVPIEPIDQRYTEQWYTNIPKILREEITERKLNYIVHTIDGLQLDEGTTKGAFLNFATTNTYKSKQVELISRLFNNNLVKPGDKFLITDAWNFAITAIKYMSELLNVPVEIHSIWHAGNYDPSDILGMRMSTNWASNQERSWYYASDYNYFATYFHLNMFVTNLSVNPSRAYRSGQPHTPIIEKLTPLKQNLKSNMIMFPHRLNGDKQPEIARDLIRYYDVLLTQEQNLSKESYYKLLGEARAVFSCSLHENLGISMMEGTLAGAIPIVPDRCSYSEMYLDVFKYPSEWTSSLDNYKKHKNDLFYFIGNVIDNYVFLYDDMEKQRQILIENYLKPTAMINHLLS